MILRYRYTKKGRIIDGQIDNLEKLTDHHEKVSAVVQNIADIEREEIIVIPISTENPSLTKGCFIFYPKCGSKETKKTIERIEILEKDESWETVSIKT